MADTNFYVACSAWPDELQQLLTCGVAISGVFTAGAGGQIANASRLYMPTLDTLRQQAEMCHNHGVRLEVLLDAPCLAARHMWVRGHPLMVEYLEQLQQAGIDAVIVSDPAMVELVKSCSHLDVVVSRVSRVDSVARAEFYEDLGADAIVLDPVLNRQRTRLERVVETLDRAQPRLLLNEGCLPGCPYMAFHHNLLAHPETPMADDYYAQNCTALRLSDPSWILKSPTIRPEDLPAYRRLLNHFCIAPRLPHCPGTQVEIVQAYERGTYEGNFCSLLGNTAQPILRNLFIDNRSLDGAWEAKWKDCLSSGECDNCQYCQGLVRKSLSTVDGE